MWDSNNELSVYTAALHYDAGIRQPLPPGLSSASASACPDDGLRPTSRVTSPRAAISPQSRVESRQLSSPRVQSFSARQRPHTSVNTNGTRHSPRFSSLSARHRIVRRAADRAIGTENTAIARTRSQNFSAMCALIKELTRIGRHALFTQTITSRTSNC